LLTSALRALFKESIKKKLCLENISQTLVEVVTVQFPMKKLPLLDV